MSDPQPVAFPAPAPMVFVDQFSITISAPGVVRLSTIGHTPVPGGVMPVAGPSFAMSIPDAQALVALIQNQIGQAMALAEQSKQPN